MLWSNGQHQRVISQRMRCSSQLSHQRSPCIRPIGNHHHTEGASLCDATPTRMQCAYQTSDQSQKKGQKDPPYLFPSPWSSRSSSLGSSLELPGTPWSSWPSFWLFPGLLGTPPSHLEMSFDQSEGNAIELLHARSGLIRLLKAL